jgi:hypothetical protein
LPPFIFATPRPEPVLLTLVDFFSKDGGMVMAPQVAEALMAEDNGAFYLDNELVRVDAPILAPPVAVSFWDSFSSGLRWAADQLTNCVRPLLPPLSSLLSFLLFLLPPPSSLLPPPSFLLPVALLIFFSLLGSQRSSLHLRQKLLSSFPE